MNTKTIHQNLLRLAVTLAVVMMTTASALAETTYITDLMLIGKNNKTEAEKLRDQYVEQGWIAIDQDLNAGCGSSSDYIYLLYKVGGLASANQSFITDIFITTEEISKIDATRTIGVRKYSLVPYDGDNHFKEMKGDLNSNAGGDDIHLYYTMDYLPDGYAISSIVFNGTQSGAVREYDLNTGAGGEDIYMHCTRDYAPTWIIEKSSDGGRCIIKGFKFTSYDEVSAIKTFPSIVCGALVVGVSTDINYMVFPNLETIYLYEEPLSHEMISMNLCAKLKHVHTVDINGNVIKSDELPTSITSIPKRGFFYCSALTKITIPASVTSIADAAFSGCGLTAFTVDEKNPTYQSVNGVLMDKSGKILVAYPCGSTTKEFVIPDGVTSILQGAFYGSSSLTSITIPKSVTSIGNDAFGDCSKLEAINVDPQNPNYKSIDGVLLDKAGKTILSFPAAYPNKNYVIPDGVTNIGEIFVERKDLTGITIPGSVESIGEKAFYGCMSLESVTIENGVGSIGKIAFHECSKLANITIPGSVTSIGDGAFEYCTSLESVTIENGVKNIGQEAFYGCSSLTSIIIPGSVESIGGGAVLGCNNLPSVSIKGNPKIGNSAIPDGTTLTLNLSANDADGKKWMTFYNDSYNFQADENTTVYKATVVGQSLVLTEVKDKIVNGATWNWDDDEDDVVITAPATAVILKSTGDPVMTRVTGRSNDTQANDLLGTMEATATPANCFTLSSGPKGVGFYRYTGSEVAAGKAYLIYNGASAAREFIGFDESGETTGIRPPLTPAVQEGKGCAWYDLYGRKLQGEPAKKGIYVRNGYTVIIK